MLKWSPTVSYSKSLADIRNQLTPAEALRQELRAKGKETRQLLKNERIWRRPDFSQAIVKIQACYRGYRLRTTISRATLRKDKCKRDFLWSMNERFEKRDFSGVVAAVEGRDPFEAADDGSSLCTIYAYSLYTLGRFEDCTERCLWLLERDARSVEIRYMLASCYVHLRRYDAAFAELTHLIGLDAETLHVSVYKLHAMVCTRVRPHRYALAITDYNYLIALHPFDMNLVRRYLCSPVAILFPHQYLEQAYLLVSLQEYDLALDNLTHILRYESNSVGVLCFR